ncbi:MAG: methyltransferase domain-containing protein [Verrucomicrobia bacterium]|nr:methyltransferase domain-containing protein [Verrucomicrobiota bacterium]
MSKANRITANIADLAHHPSVSAPDLADLTEYYDRRFSGEYCKKHHDRHNEQLQTMLECVPRTLSCAKVLDYGCGAGGCTELLKEFFPESEIHGIDISNEAIRTAQTRYPDCYFAGFDGALASYPGESFDLIFSSHVLEHVLDLEKSIFDMARMVRKGGCVCITLPCANEGSLEWKLTTLMRDGCIESPTGEEKWCWEDPSHLRRMKSRDLVALFSRHDLRLQTSFFGNQFWGGVEGVCACGPGMVLKWLQVSRGKSVKAKATLAISKTLLLLTSPVFLANMDLRRKAQGFSGLKKTAAYAAIPVRWIYLPLAKLLKSLADHEWVATRAESTGASQFLVFQKV